MFKGRHAIMLMCVGMLLPLGGGVPEVEAAVEKTLERGAEVLAQEIAESLPQEKKPLLAVLDFSDLSDCVSAFGRLTSEELVTKLFKTKRARVVERGLLKKALAELKFNLSELVDSDRAKQLGKQVGADTIVSGTVSDMGASVKINARVIDVERGDVLTAAGVEIAKDESVKQLVSQTLSCPGNEKSPGLTEAMKQEKPPKPEPLARGVKYQEFTEVRVELESLTGTKSSWGGLGMTLLLNYVNKTDKELVIGLTDSMNRDTFLLDSKGNRYSFTEGTGLSGSWCGQNWCNPSNTSLLHVPPKDSAAASLSFSEPCCRPTFEIKEGSTFRFSSHQAFVEDGIPKRALNLSIRDVPLSQ
jgi:TolB-like protein